VHSNLSRRQLLQLSLAAASIHSGYSWAQADKPFRVVCITPPGAILDSTSRLVAQGLKNLTGRPAVVENRTGAGGNIATDIVAKSPADGSTLLVTSNNHTTNAALYKSLPYDAEKDLIPVAHVADFAMVLVASPATGIKSISDLVQRSKSRPDGLLLATGGKGSPGHIAAEVFSQLSGAKLQHVPYKGASPAMTDTVSGQVELACGSLSSALPFIKSGQLKALAVSGQTRAKSAPEIPTFLEEGVKGYDYTGWIGVFAPRGVPASVIASLHSAITMGLDVPEVHKALESQGGVLMKQSTAQFEEMLRVDFERNRKLVQALNLKLD
jgi:tripartite-type tricarboxylate transporter receptor subunit TctC